MDYFRLFISLPVETTLAKKIMAEFQSLDLPWEKLKNINPEQLHLTLKFLGDTPLDKIPLLVATLEKIKTDLSQLDLNINQAILIQPHRPQVVSLQMKPSQNLQILYDAIEQNLFTAGLAHKEMRRFLPHLTLARIKQSATEKEFAALKKWTINKSFSVNHFDLQESQLTPRGPIYTTLQSFNL